MANEETKTETTPDQTEAQTPPAEEAAQTPVIEGAEKDATGVAETTEASAPEAAKTPAPAEDDDPEVEVGDEVVPLSELVAAYGAHKEALALKEEAQQKIEAANAVAEALRDNPMDTLLRVFTNELGSPQRAYYKIVDLAERVLTKHLEYENMPEEQRNALRRQHEVDSKEQTLKQKEAEIAKREAEAAEIQMAQEITEEVRSALKEAKVDANAKTMASIFEIMHKAAEIGIELPASKAIVKYQRALAQQREALLKDLKPDQLPAELRQGVSKQNIAAVKGTAGTPAAKTSKKAEPKDDGGYKVLSTADWDEYLHGK